MEDTILKEILRNCSENGDRPVHQWTDERGEIERAVTYGQLGRRSRELAEDLLTSLQIRRGERAVLCYPPGIDFSVSLMACLRAGIIAVPVNPPTLPNSYTTSLLEATSLDCSPKCVLTNNHYLQNTDPRLMEQMRAQTGIPWHSTSDIEKRDKAQSTPTVPVLDRVESTDVPLLQYTSGTNGHPSGVMHTHKSLLHNFRLMQECMRCDHAPSAISLLPHSHPLGLLCHYLFIPYCGGTCLFISPDAFSKSPSLWALAVSTFRGKFSLLPNSALDLVTSAELSADDVVDLGSLRFLGNGSESVSAETMRRFSRKFSSCGLREGVLQAFYGLSEHTMFLSASAGEELVVEGSKVSNGRPHPSVTVKIVDPETRREVGEGEEGEVWVEGESKAAGYWKREEQSKEVFHAELEGDGERTYLRTGDMGFLLSGHLFVSGRRGNVMVVGGRGVCMTEVENRLEAQFPELRPGRTVAVEWDSTLALADHSTSPTAFQAPRRGIGFFAEHCTEDYLQAADCHVLAEKIAAQIGLDFRVETQLVALLPPDTMPLTGCGKRHRPLCKAGLLGGLLQVVYQWSPASTESRVAVKPECVPLPPTPIPRKQSAAKLAERSPMKQVPDLKLEGSPTTEELAVAVPRKESRFCLEDAPSAEAGESLEALAAVEVPQTTPHVKHLAPPDAAERERSRGLVGQETAVLSIIGTVLAENIEMDTNIWDHGCDSLSAVEISGRLEQHLGFSVEPHLLFAYQTPRALLEKLKRTLLHLCSPVSAGEPATGGAVVPPLLTCGRRSLLPSHEDEVAVVGMACLFPGSSSPEELWQSLTEKTVPISHFQDPATGSWIHGAFSDRTAVFDHKWFNVTEKEASTMDPQQSLLLHTASECLRRSGYRSPDEVRGSKIGVFVGFWGSDARAMSLESEKRPPYTSYIGTLAANRISYTFDLKGPSLTVDTACAASLAALEVAFSFLHRGKCSEALVGGVNALLDPRVFEVSSEMGVTSPRGESRVFDAEARGYVRGEGCGMLLLKTVGDAVKHGNRILAVVKSVESLHNGASATLTAPSKQAQSQLLRASLDSAMLAPGDLSYLEAHGTGTPLGDPMEMAAISEVFGQPAVNREPRVGPLIVGSIKANIGHLEAAAGMAGLIKTVLVLEHARAPGNPGLETVNPALKIEPDKILLPREMVGLDSHFMYRPQSCNLLSAAVSSFGIGGSIASAVLQQYAQLPHLGQTECSLTLGGEIGDVTQDQVMTAIQLLRARLRPFNSAYLSCVEAFQRAIKPVRILASETYYHHPAYLVFCLLYGVARTLQAHDLELSLLMGTTLCAEVVVLAVADVLILSDAMRLLLAGMAPHVFNIKFIIEEEMQPATSFLSPTLNQLCLPGRFPPASLNQLIHEIQTTPLMQSTCSDPSLTGNLVSIARAGYGPLLVVTLQPDSPIVKTATKTCKTASLLRLNAPGLIHHLRETCLQLRTCSDKMAAKEERPAVDVEMPGFYERYPMRAAQRGPSPQQVKGQDRRKTPGNSHAKTGDAPKPKHRLSCADESGYLTQTTSAESLKSSTPASSPAKPHPKPHPPAPTVRSDPTPSVTPSDEAIFSGGLVTSDEAIFSGLVTLVRRELLTELSLSDQEAGEKQLAALGLDSVALVELQDHLLHTWQVDLPLLRMMTDLCTLKAIAGEVAQLSAENERERAKRGRYYTVPSAEELSLVSKEKLSSVPNFTVGRWGFGKVEFFGTADISEVDLGSQLVEIEPGSIRLCKGGRHCLNRPALLFFKSALPQGVGGASRAGDPARELVKSLGDSAHLVNSDWATGEVVVKIEKFPEHMMA